MWELVLKDSDLLAMFVLSWRVHRGDGRDDRKARDMILGAVEDGNVDILLEVFLRLGYVRLVSFLETGVIM